MALYSRHQLALLLLALAVLGLGLAVGHWRRSHPDVVERLERFDQAPTPAPRRDPGRSRDGGARLPSAPPTRGEAALPALKPPRLGAPEPGALVDLNRGSPGELERLPGVGPVLAARIVEARAQGGPFAAVDDLRRVRGLGPVTLEGLRALVTPGARSE